MRSFLLYRSVNQLSSISSPCEACLHPAAAPALYVITAHQAGLLLRHRGFPLAACSTRGSVCMSALLSQLVSSPCPASTSESLFLPSKQVHLCRFSSFRAVRNRLVISNSLQPHSCGLPDSSVHGIFQARILEQIAISRSRGSSVNMQYLFFFL